MDSHAEYFPKNLGDFNDGLSERFHQVVKIMQQTILRKIGWKYDGWLLLDVEERCTSGRKYEKKNVTMKVFRMQKSAW